MINLKKILISNRGEIARRIMRTGREMGYTCCVIYSREDANTDFVTEADEAYDLGNGNLLETYLNIPKIISIALHHGIQAIHPGYGLLSENFLFAQACEENNIIFIGPTQKNIKLMSQKHEARKLAHSLDIPLLASVYSHNILDLISLSSNLNYPVIVKAVSGGGGKGMYIVHEKEVLKDVIEKAGREAYSYFGDPSLYIEEYLESPRHIEVQLLGDNYGNIVHLFERDCTIQRRHQKIIEEAPALTLRDDVRKNIIDSALKIANTIGYVSAGTIEFLMDEKQTFYFLEMNTRVQVEHPVTEMITGIDIIKEQFNIAEGRHLSFKQEDIYCKGHAIECRIYAENPFKEFKPSSGSIITYIEPSENIVRIDSSIKGPAVISDNYDPMISKLISYGPDRESARVNLLNSLHDYIIHGIDTNITYIIEILNHPLFIQNSYSTAFCIDSSHFLHKSHEKRIKESPVELIVAAFLIFNFSPGNSQLTAPGSPAWQNFGYWRNLMVTEINVLGKNYKVSFKKQSSNTFTFNINDNHYISISGNVLNARVDFNFSMHRYVAFMSILADTYYISLSGVTISFFRNDIIKIQDKKDKINNFPEPDNHILAPLNGKIIIINIKLHEMVNKGDVLMVLESMKMENYIIAPRSGQITKLLAHTGDRVTGRDVLAILT